MDKLILAIIASKAVALKTLAITTQLCFMKYKAKLDKDNPQDHEKFYSGYQVTGILITDKKLENDFDVQNERHYTEIEKAMDIDLRDHRNCFQFIKDNVSKISFRDELCLLKYSDMCLVLRMAAKSILSENVESSDVKKFIQFEQALRSKTDQAIGYWTCMMHKTKLQGHKGSGKQKSNSPQFVLHEITIQFLNNNRDLLKKETEIAKQRFFRQHIHEELYTIDGIAYEVSILKDRRHIVVTNMQNKKSFSKIKDTTFQAKYIGAAKKSLKHLIE